MGDKRITYAVVAIILIVTILVSMPSKTVAKMIETDSKFRYTTSVTGNYSNSDRANVYTTGMSVPDAARYIIKQKKPLSHTDLNNEQSINLTYDDHYVLVYKGEEGKTYVQVSSRKYVHRNGFYGLYRPFDRNIIVFYDDIYRGWGHYRTDEGRYGGGYYRQPEPETPKSNSDSKIRTDNNSSGKIRTDQNASSKIRTGSSSGSIRSGSIGSRPKMGGGTSFGK
ncbi:MAG: hypothetical protein PWR27_1775 [Petroclostridium sp.]|jgi:hypothetical protein|nr:hypothetical protein [Clostridia bacterium]MDK2811066.1 hypothetical protein [Petroclostridium sp.]